MTVLQANAVSAVQAIGAGTHTASQDSGSIAVPAGSDYAMVIVNAGTFTGDENVTIKVQGGVAASESDITGAAFAAITTANDDAVYVGVLRLRSNAGSLKVDAAHTGTGNGLYGVTVLFMSHQYADDAATTFVFNVSDDQ